MSTKKGAIVSKTGKRFAAKKTKYHDNLQKKRQLAQKRYYDMKESIISMKKKNTCKIKHQKLFIKKQSISIIPKSNI